MKYLNGSNLKQIKFILQTVKAYMKKKSLSQKMICAKCGSRRIKVEWDEDRNVCVVCKDCGHIIRKIKTIDEQTRIENLIRTERLEDDEAYIIVRNDCFGNIVGKCSSCRNLLFNRGNLPFKYAAFNLMDANYCPNCGKKFI